MIWFLDLIAWFLKINDTHKENCVYWFYCLHDQNSYKIYCYILNSTDVLIHQIERKLAIAPFSNFYDKIWFGFCLYTWKPFSSEISFHFKTNRKSIGSSKNGTRDFQNSPPLERSACFYPTITGNFERFQCCNFKANFLKNENLL